TEAGNIEYWECVDEGCGKYFSDSKATKEITDKNSVKIAAKGHTPVPDAAVAATCIKSGRTAGTHCSVCHKVITPQTVIPATGKHTWNAGKVTISATCKDTGVKTFTCTICNTTKTEPIPKTSEHAWDAGKVTTPATCKDTGVKTFTCTRCNTTRTVTIAKTSEHAWNAGEITKQPTYVSEGEKTYICTVCGETKVEVLDMKHLDMEPVIIANEGEFKKAFEEAINGGAKTLRVKLTNDLDLAKIGKCMPVFSIGEDEYHTSTLVNFNLEIDLNGHNICLNALNTTLTLGNNSILILRNGTMKGFLCEMEGNAEAYLENVTLNDAGLNLTNAGIGISAETGWLAHIGSAILELNNCKAICTSDNGEERFDITKDNLNKCCIAQAFLYDEPKFWAEIRVNEEKAIIDGNQLEY
ncbi:MAG: hypothetical protein SPG74_04570, partial [Eubacteriales bacterium]|nr:hypothetical protein [Eubacteriales bacterium]